MNAPTMIHL